MEEGPRVAVEAALMRLMSRDDCSRLEVALVAEGVPEMQRSLWLRAEASRKRIVMLRTEARVAEEVESTAALQGGKRTPDSVARRLALDTQHLLLQHPTL